MATLLYEEEKIEEIEETALDFSAFMQERMILKKNLKKKRWRSDGVTPQHLLDGCEHNLDKIYDLADRGASYKQMKGVVADAANFLMMFLDRYGMEKNDITEIELGKTPPPY